MHTKINKYFGTMVTILAIGLLEYTAIRYKMSTIIAIFAMLIIFSIYKGGVFSGISSAVIAISYMSYLKEGKAVNCGFACLSNNEFALDILCIIGIGIFAAIMDYKYKSYYEKYKEADTYLARAKEISEVMICHSTIDGKIIKVHPKLYSLLGYTQDEFLGMSTWDVIHPEDVSKEQELINDVIKGSIDTFNTEKRLCKKNGEIVWVFCNVSAVKDNDGEIIYLLRYLLDITEQKIMREQLKNTEKELRHSEGKYRSLVELDPDAIMIHEGSIITFINNAGMKMLGASKSEDIIGKNVYEFVHPDYEFDVRTEVDRACINLNCPGLPFELKMISQDGREIDVESIDVGLSNGNDIQIIAIIRDITERKKAEGFKKAAKESEKRLAEAKEYDKIRNEFFANISHELRTPLNIILSTLQLLSIHKGKDKSDKSDKYLDIMKHNCYRLLRLVSNLIDITKIDTGYFHINMGRYNIVRIVEDITLSAADYIKSKGLSLEFDADVEKIMINCDPDQMERIMLNLISNSVKFTKPGGKIRISINNNGKSVIIRVRDTGVGIPLDKQKDIFERFRQVDKSFTRECEGSGIGLYLVKSLVEMQGGTISLISRPGHGSLFIIEISIDEDTSCLEKESAPIEAEHIERIEVEFSDIYS